MERRLSAIFAADMVGYSRLMEADEIGTIERQKTHRKELIDPAFAKHRGRIFKTTGDGLLAEFPSVVDAVQCAVAIQRAMAEREADIEEDKRIQYRIGINLGDVVVDDDGDIYGDGVNVAARLEQLAEPGGIRISGTTFDHLKSQVEVGYEPLGEVQVKNIVQPVRTYRVITDPNYVSAAAVKRPRRIPVQYAAMMVFILLLAIGAGSWWWLQRPDFEPVDPAQMALKLPDKPSIAVLPFDYLGNKEDDSAYLADGLSENITAYLSQIPDIFVIARNSAFTYKGKAVDVREVSERFGVRYVIEGSLLRSRDSIRVTAQLIDALKGKHIWAESYDRKLEDYFAILDEITVAIISNFLSETVSGYRGHQNFPDNIDAAIEVAKGLSEQLHYTKDTNYAARLRFERAVELDPNYAVAYSGIGHAHFVDVANGFSSDPKQSLTLAEEFTAKAQELSDGKIGLSNMAQIRMIQRRYEEAIKLALRAIEITPSDAGAQYTVSRVFRQMGQPQKAMEYLKVAQRLLPVSAGPLVGIFQVDELVLNLELEDFDAALEVGKKVLDNTSKQMWPFLLPNIAYANWELGNKEEAKQQIDQSLELLPSLSISRFRPFHSIYLDPDIPGKRYPVWRELGIPDTPPPELPDKPSIAVLPFDNLSNDQDQQYFADGLIEDLITDLSKVPDLFVISRNSSFAYRDTAADVKRVARELGVRHVLEGSVRRAGDTIRINAQLIDGTDNSHIWAERYDGKTENVFALQDEIVAEIIAALSLRLTGAEQSNLAAGKTKDPAAYDAFLKGWELYRQGTPDSYAKAIPLLNNAVEIDPSYSRAHGVLAAIYWDGHFRGWKRILGFKTDKDIVAKTIEHLEPAMRNPEPLAHIVRSRMLSRLKQDYEGAIKEARRAIELDPNFAEGHVALALELAYAGKTDEALAQLDIAKRIDPQLPALYGYVIGAAHYIAGDYQKAAAALESDVEKYPTNWYSSWLLTGIYGHLGEQEKAAKAREMFDEEQKRLNPDHPGMIAGYAFLFAVKNDAVRKRFFEDLKLAGVPESLAPLNNDEVERKLSTVEAKQLLIPSSMSGTMVEPNGQISPITWHIDEELHSSANVYGIEWKYNLRFEDGKLCMERGCFEVHELNDVGAGKWRHSHVIQETIGTLYYVTFLKKEAPKSD